MVTPILDKMLTLRRFCRKIIGGTNLLTVLWKIYRYLRYFDIAPLSHNWNETREWVYKFPRSWIAEHLIASNVNKLVNFTGYS